MASLAELIAVFKAFQEAKSGNWEGIAGYITICLATEEALVEPRIL
jgi:hypothetical protein